MDKARQRRLSFGSVAEAYARSRPSYPAELVADLVGKVGGECESIRAIEVGAGTGKATALFAASGISVDAIEPSAEMAAVARRELAGFPKIRVIESDFEGWMPDADPYDLLISAQAWHWTDPERRYELARTALRRDGILCPFWNLPDWSGCSLTLPHVTLAVCMRAR